MPESNGTEHVMELGTWVGKRQAFGLIANKCSAADAECLKQIRHSRNYLSVANTWEEFCPRYLGLSRAQADRLIHQLEEFGAAYFELAKIVRIPDVAYKTAIAAAISGHAIEFHGQKIPICAENGSRIAEAVKFLIEDAAVSTRCLDGLTTAVSQDVRRKRISAIGRRFDAACADLEVLCGEPGDRTRLTAFLERAQARLAQLAAIVPEPFEFDAAKGAKC